MTGPDETVWRIGDDVAVVADERHGEGRVHLLALSHATTHQVPVVVSGTGLYLWTLLEQGPHRIGQLVAGVVADFPGAPAEAVRADVAAFVAELGERGILVSDGDPAVTPDA